MKNGLALALLVGLLCACGVQQPATPTPPPGLQPLFIYHPPALRPLAEPMAECAREQPGLALYREELPAPPELSRGEIWLNWGIAPENRHTFSLGTAVLQVIVPHPGRTPGSLSSEALRGLFDGSVQTWENGDEARVWVYALDDPLWRTFAAALALAQPPSNAQIAPDPQAMLDAVAADPQAIGLLPGFWHDGRVTFVTLNEKLAEKLSQPITASLSEPPTGEIAAWLACLQGRWRP